MRVKIEYTGIANINQYFVKSTHIFCATYRFLKTADRWKGPILDLT